MDKKVIFILIGVAGILCMCVILVAGGLILVGSKSSKTCEYNGQTYQEGDSFKSDDGCNTCGCNNGMVACTLMACVTDTPKPLITPKPTLEASGTKCTSDEIGISFDIPTSWSCSVDKETPMLTLDSTYFYAEFTPYGRGYCEGETECKITELYKSQYMDIFTVEYEGSSESLGIVNKSEEEWVTAVYNVRYDKQAEAEITKVLNSLEFTK